MKQIILAGVFACLLARPGFVRAQAQAGQVVFSGSIAYSSFYSNMNYNYMDQNSSGHVTSVHPAFNGFMDIYTSEGKSIGACVSYQSLTTHINGYIINKLDSTGHFPIKDVTEKVSRLNVGFRVLAHGSSKYADLYGGLRVGMSFWKDTNDSGDDAFQPARGNHAYLSFQIPVGLAIYPTRAFGIHIELAVGTPYQVAGGINLKLSKK